MVGLQAPKRGFALLDYVHAVVARGVGILVIHASVDLRCQHYPLPLPVTLEGFTDDFLACATAVHVGGVQEVDTRVDSSIYDVERRGFVSTTSKHHASKTQLTYLS